MVSNILNVIFRQQTEGSPRILMNTKQPTYSYVFYEIEAHKSCDQITLVYVRDVSRPCLMAARPS